MAVEVVEIPVLLVTSGEVSQTWRVFHEANAKQQLARLDKLLNDGYTVIDGFTLANTEDGAKNGLRTLILHKPSTS